MSVPIAEALVFVAFTIVILTAGCLLIVGLADNSVSYTIEEEEIEGENNGCSGEQEQVAGNGG